MKLLSLTLQREIELIREQALYAQYCMQTPLREAGLPKSLIELELKDGKEIYIDERAVRELMGVIESGLERNEASIGYRSIFTADGKIFTSAKDLADFLNRKSSYSALGRIPMSAKLLYNYSAGVVIGTEAHFRITRRPFGNSVSLRKLQIKSDFRKLKVDSYMQSIDEILAEFSARLSLAQQLNAMDELWEPSAIAFEDIHELHRAFHRLDPKAAENSSIYDSFRSGYHLEAEDLKFGDYSFRLLRCSGCSAPMASRDLLATAESVRIAETRGKSEELMELSNAILRFLEHVDSTHSCSSRVGGQRTTHALSA